MRWRRCAWWVWWAALVAEGQPEPTSVEESRSPCAGPWVNATWYSGSTSVPYAGPWYNNGSSAVSDAAPETCPDGWYLPETTEDACLPCPPGTVRPRGRPANLGCIICDEFSYQPDEGQTRCVPCGPNARIVDWWSEDQTAGSKKELNTDPSGCLCTEGSYSLVWPIDKDAGCRSCQDSGALVAGCAGGTCSPVPETGTWFDPRRLFVVDDSKASAKRHLELKSYPCRYADYCRGGDAPVAAAGNFTAVASFVLNKDDICVDARGKIVELDVGGQEHWCYTGLDVETPLCENRRGAYFMVSTLPLGCPSNAMPDWVFTALTWTALLVCFYLINDVLRGRSGVMDIFFDALQDLGIISSFRTAWPRVMQAHFLVFRLVLFDVDTVEPNCSFPKWNWYSSFCLVVAMPTLYAVFRVALFLAVSLNLSLADRRARKKAQRIGRLSPPARLSTDDDIDDADDDASSEGEKNSPEEKIEPRPTESGSLASKKSAVVSPTTTGTRGRFSSENSRDERTTLAWNRCVNSTVSFLFQSSPTLIARCLEAFTCRRFKATGTRLEASPADACGTRVHAASQIVAGLVLAAVLVALPGIIFGRLWVLWFKNRLCHKDSLQVWGQFYGQFQADALWWGAVRFLKQVALSLVASLLWASPRSQALVIVLILVGVVAVQTRIRPCLSSAHNWIEFFGLVAAVHLALVSLTLPSTIPGGGFSVQDIEQHGEIGRHARIERRAHRTGYFGLQTALTLAAIYFAYCEASADRARRRVLGILHTETAAAEGDRLQHESIDSSLQSRKLRRWSKRASETAAGIVDRVVFGKKSARSRGTPLPPQEIASTFKGRCFWRYVRSKGFDFAKVAELDRVIEPFVADHSATNNFSASSEASFYRRLDSVFPSLIDLLVRCPQHRRKALRTAISIIANEDYVYRAAGRTEETAAVVEQVDRSSVLFFLLHCPPKDRALFRDVARDVVLASPVLTRDADKVAALRLAFLIQRTFRIQRLRARLKLTRARTPSYPPDTSWGGDKAQSSPFSSPRAPSLGLGVSIVQDDAVDQGSPSSVARRGSHPSSKQRHLLDDAYAPPFAWRTQIADILQLPSRVYHRRPSDSLSARRLLAQHSSGVLGV